MPPHAGSGSADATTSGIRLEESQHKAPYPNPWPVWLPRLDRFAGHMTAARGRPDRVHLHLPPAQNGATVKFVIGKDAQVASAKLKSSSLASPSVGSCIRNRFMHFSFPEPKGAGIVIGSYPLALAHLSRAKPTRW